MAKAQQQESHDSAAYNRAQRAALRKKFRNRLINSPENTRMSHEEAIRKCPIVYERFMGMQLSPAEEEYAREIIEVVITPCENNNNSRKYDRMTIGLGSKFFHTFEIPFGVPVRLPRQLACHIADKRHLGIKYKNPPAMDMASSRFEQFELPLYSVAGDV